MLHWRPASVIRRQQLRLPSGSSMVNMVTTQSSKLCVRQVMGGKSRGKGNDFTFALARVCITNCTKHKGNPLHLSPMAAGVELPALLQLIQEKVQFVMHTLLVYLIVISLQHIHQTPYLKLAYVNNNHYFSLRIKRVRYDSKNQNPASSALWLFYPYTFQSLKSYRY